MELKKNWRLAFLTIFLLSSLCHFPQPAPADSPDGSESELLLIAQKAFDDGFYDVAIRYVNQFLEQYPNTEKRVEVNLLLGQCFFFKGQYLKAFDIFEKLLAYPVLKDATLFWLGETYLKGSDYKQAENQYRQIIDVYPDSTFAPQAFYSLGWALFAQKEFEKAKNTFNEFIKKFPSQVLLKDAHFKTGECEYNLRNYKEAIRLFQKFVTKFNESNEHDQAYFYIAESFYYLEDYPQAVSYYTKAKEISRDDKLRLMSTVGLGWSKLKLKEFEKSQQYFDDALTLSQEKGIPSDDVFLGRATLFSEMENYQKSLEAYEQLLAAFPDSPRIAESRLGKANCLYLLKNYDDAVKEYSSIISQFSPDPNFHDLIEKAYFGLAWTNLKTGKIYLAIRNFQNVVDQTQSKAAKASALTQMGDAYQDIGELDKALEIYDKILQEFPDSPYSDYIQYRQGIAFLKMDKIDAATLSFQSLQANFPASKYLTDVKYYLGLAYFKKNDWAAAKEQLSSFISELPKNHELQKDAHYVLGLSYLNLNNPKEAMAIFEKIVKNYPEDEAILRDSEMNIAKCFYNLDDAKEAVKKFKILIYKYAKTETAFESMMWLGDYYLKTADYENAIRYYRQLINEFPDHAKINLAHYQLGNTYQEQGSLSEALNEYKFISDPTDRELYTKAKLAIADIFSTEASPETAIAAYQKITESSPEFTRDAFIKIAEIYQNQGDHPHAIEAYEQALRSDMGLSKINNAEIQFDIADLCETLNKPNEAMEAYLKIPYLYPNETSWIVKSYLRLARIFEETKDWENAKLAYTKIIKYGTDEAKFAQERLEWIAGNVASLSK